MDVNLTKICFGENGNQNLNLTFFCDHKSEKSFWSPLKIKYLSLSKIVFETLGVIVLLYIDGIFQQTLKHKEKVLYKFASFHISVSS